MIKKYVSLSVIVRMCMVAISGVLLLSCGKGGSSADSISDDGLFGSVGAEFVDLFLNEPDENEVRYQIAEEVEGEMLRKYPDYENMHFRARPEIQAELRQKYDEAWEKHDYPGLKEKWDKRLAELVAEMSTIEVPVKVEEGTPFKLLSPVKLMDFDKTIKDKKFVIGFTVELTEDVKLQKKKFPEFKFMNASDSVLHSSFVWGESSANSLEEGIKKGTRLDMEVSLNFSSHEDAIKDFFSAKYVMLTWNTFFVEDGKLGPVQVGMSYKDLPKSVPVLYDKFDYRKEMIESEMDGDYEVEECIFFNDGKEYFRAVLEDGKIASIILDQNSTGLFTKEDYRVGSDVVTSLYYISGPTRSGGFKTVVINESLEWENYYEGEVFVTIGRYTFYVPSDQANTEFPRTRFDFKYGAKFSRIICK